MLSVVGAIDQNVDDRLLTEISTVSPIQPDVPDMGTPEDYYPDDTNVSFVRVVHRNFEDGSSIETHFDESKSDADKVVFIDITRGDGSSFFLYLNSQDEWVEVLDGTSTVIGDPPLYLETTTGGVFEWAEINSIEPGAIRSEYNFDNIPGDDTRWTSYVENDTEEPSLVHYTFALADGTILDLVVEPSSADSNIDPTTVAQAYMDRFVQLPTGIRDKLSEIPVILTGDIGANGFGAAAISSGYPEWGERALLWNINTFEDHTYDQFQGISIHEAGHLLNLMTDPEFEMT